MSGHTSSAIVVLQITNGVYIPEVAQGLFREWEEPWLDLFATAENAQCQHFCALEFPKWLSQGDSFHLEWNSGLLYAFPPIPLLPRVLKKIIA